MLRTAGANCDIPGTRYARIYAREPSNIIVVLPNRKDVYRDHNLIFFSSTIINTTVQANRKRPTQKKSSAANSKRGLKAFSP